MSEFLLYFVDLCKTVNIEESKREEYERYFHGPFYYRSLAVPLMLKMIKGKDSGE